MTVARKRWLFAQTDLERIRDLATELSISPILAQLLWQRNIRTAEQAKRFLYPQREHCYDPFVMKDMDRAVSRLRQAIQAREKILVYGDYDVDGSTSTAIAYLVLKQLGADVDPYIPDRFSEGYGLNLAAIENAHRQGYTVILTVDNGISAIDQCQLAKRLGIDLIVTDHHQPPDVLPDAYAILNPKQPGCAYPDKMLAGAGIAWKLAHALLGSFPAQYLDLAALGTIADLAPLVDENRVIAYYGLQALSQSTRPGIQSLLQVSGLANRPITAGHVGFALGPRINASGRLETALHALELLITDDKQRAFELACMLNEINQERQDLCDSIFQEAVQMIENHPDWLGQRVLVVAKEGWNIGVIGIVASRLVERYYKPTVVLSIGEHEAKGSARSVDGFNLYEALKTCSDLFDHFGGHTMAAGLSLAAEHIETFRIRFNQAAEAVWQEEWTYPKLDIDVSLGLPDATLDLLDAVAKLEPYGVGNPKPKFHLPNLRIDQVRAVGRDNHHLQFRLSDGTLRISGIAFKRGEELEDVQKATVLDIVGELECNEWNGIQSVQILIHDWKPPTAQEFPSAQAVRETAAGYQEEAPEPGERMVYDLREQVSKRGLRDLLQRVISRHDRIQILVFHKGMYAYHKQTLETLEPSSARVQMASPTGEIEKRNDFDQMERPLVLVDYPFSIGQYRNILKEMKPSVIYLMQGLDAQELVNKQCEHWLPGRDQFANLYRIIRHYKRLSKQEALRHWQEVEDPGTANERSLSLLLQVFAELGFLTLLGEGIEWIPHVTKRQLHDSPTYQSRYRKVQDYQEAFQYFNSIKGERIWI
jgi:single-stranded-DNA-specific exonuclease